jgi:hypothetical protein
MLLGEGTAPELLSSGTERIAQFCAFDLQLIVLGVENPPFGAAGWRARTTEDPIACRNLWLPKPCYPRSTGSVSQSR